MMSSVRCNELKKKALTESEPKVKALAEEAKKGLMPRFGKRVLEVKEACLTLYDTTASRYDENIYAGIREEMLIHLSSALYPSFNAQLEKLISQTQKTMRIELDIGLEKGMSFAEVCEQSKTRNTWGLRNQIQKSQVFEQWQLNSDFDEIFDEIIYSCRKSALKDLKEKNLVFF